MAGLWLTKFVAKSSFITSALPPFQNPSTSLLMAALFASDDIGYSHVLDSGCECGRQELNSERDSSIDFASSLQHDYSGGTFGPQQAVVSVIRRVVGLSLITNTLCEDIMTDELPLKAPGHTLIKQHSHSYQVTVVWKLPAHPEPALV